ncbi:MAG: DAK2 domain-containing protein [Firmicutes bacterium]|nr:DAK2 domain-containing protein [Bacillota bacterium]
MSVSGIDGNLLRKMIIAGANELSGQRAAIDALNVFPVPDGDTGANMSMTVIAAAKEAGKTASPNAGDVAKAASNGSLRGARGNSGVILSQLFRGFAKGLDGVGLADGRRLAEAFRKASDTAYKAVMKPREGTILTVAREMGEQAAESAENGADAEGVIRDMLARGRDVLERTTEMLAELRQAGVVDAGGKGLIVFLEGAASVIGSDAEVSLDAPEAAGAASAPAQTAAAMSSADIRFAYCTEFFIDIKAGERTSEEIENEMTEFLSALGDSIVAAADEEIVKIHVHTNHPGNVLERAMRYGSLSSIKIENMRLQHTTLINFSAKKPEPRPKSKHSPLGVVAVASGAGFRDLFISLGADEVVEGGQTMNPSAEDILDAIGRVDADAVIVLPNNGNIVLAAQQAASLCQGKKAFVAPSKTIPQGLAAMVSYMPSADAESNVSEMTKSLGQVKTGQVTRAVRDARIGGKDIREGDYICILDGEIAAVNSEREPAVEELLDVMLRDGGDVVSLYYGEGVSEADAGTLADYVREKYQESELELYDGGQPVYDFIVSVE